MKCETCAMVGGAHDPDCWRGQVQELSHALRAVLGDPSEGSKTYAARVLDKVLAKNDPNHKRVYDPITGCRN